MGSWLGSGLSVATASLHGFEAPCLRPTLAPTDRIRIYRASQWNHVGHLSGSCRTSAWLGSSGAPGPEERARTGQVLLREHIGWLGWNFYFRTRSTGVLALQSAGTSCPADPEPIGWETTMGAPISRSRERRVLSRNSNITCRIDNGSSSPMQSPSCQVRTSSKRTKAASGISALM